MSILGRDVRRRLGYEISLGKDTSLLATDD